MKMLTASALVAAMTAAPGLADGLEPGSVLVFPFHRTNIAGGATFFTAVAVTNTNLVPATPNNGLGGTTGAHYEYVNVTPNPNPNFENLPLACDVANRVEFLTPADIRAVLTNCDNGGNAEGYLVVSATDPNTLNSPWSHNYLVGSELAVSASSGMWYLNAIPFKSPKMGGELTDMDLDGELDFDGIEYEGIPDHLIIDSFVADVFPSLILINLSGGTAFTANVAFDVFNDNEQPLSATYAFRCWVEVPLVDISNVFDPGFLANNFNNDPTELDTDCDGSEDANTGWARIRGVNHFSTVETCPDAALLGAIGQSFTPVPVGARRLWESKAKQFDGDFLKTGTDDPECGDTNQAPICDAGESQTAEPGETVMFDGSGSVDPDGGSLNFKWNFGDGNMANGAMVSHSYADSGTFNVTLMVTDDEGRSRSCGLTVTVIDPNQAPTCDAGGPYSGDIGVPIQFDGTGSSDPDGGSLTFSWDFGDGEMGTGAMPMHTYDTPGAYTVTLTVTDDEGRQATPCMADVTVDDPNLFPICDAGGPYTVDFDAQPVQFDGSGSSDPDGGSVTFSWDFGDGNMATGAMPTHTYATPGDYVVTLTVTDDEGRQATPCTADVTVNGLDPVCVIDPTPPPGPNGPVVVPVQQANIMFDASNSFDPDGGTIVSYDWDFDDGTFGSGVMVTHQFAANGVYDVVLTITDDEGMMSMCVQRILVD